MAQTSRVEFCNSQRLESSEMAEATQDTVLDDDLCAASVLRFAAKSFQQECAGKCRSVSALVLRLLTHAAKMETAIADSPFRLQLHEIRFVWLEAKAHRVGEGKARADKILDDLIWRDGNLQYSRLQL